MRRREGRRRRRKHTQGSERLPPPSRGRAEGRDRNEQWCRLCPGAVFRSVHGTERRGGGRPRLTLLDLHSTPRLRKEGGGTGARHFIFHAARLLPNSQGQEKGDRTQRRRRRRLSQMADTQRRRRRRAAAKEDQGRQGRKEGLMHTRRKRASPEISSPPAHSKGTKLVLHTAPMQKGT